MNTTALIRKLEWAEVDPARALDARTVLRDERFALISALRTGDPARIGRAKTEAERVLRLWEGF